MAVLECLWANQNQVVSQQQIFEQVWPNAIFNPSSVQRSIAILRKTLEQDSKNPEFIITHPKRGYSLVVVQQMPANKAPIWKQPWPMFITLLATLCFVTGSAWMVSQNHAPSFNQLRPLTSSESSEYELVLSPKSDMAAFVRIGNGKNNHIWLKNLRTGKERQISQDAASYRKLGWAKNGSALVYLDRTDAFDQIVYRQIDPYNLTAMPAVPLLALPANSVVSYQLQWSSQGDIYFVQNDKNATSLLRQYSIALDKLTTLKSFQGNKQLVTVALSPDESKLALALDIHQNKNNLALMNLDSLEVADLVTIEGKIQGLNWHPDNQSLLISNREKLQSVSLNKQVTDIDFDNFKYIRNASYSFDGKEIMMELISLDVDILHSKQPEPYNYQWLVDTQSLDFLPIYSPQEDRFAFESHRNGTKQLFIYEHGQQRLMFTNPDNHELFGLVWSPDGQQIITASKDKLFVIDVQAASYQEIAHDQGRFYLREWYQHEDALLVSLVTENGFTPAKFDLSSQQLSILFDSSANFECAYMTLDKDDRLFFSDYQNIYQLTAQGELLQLYKAEKGQITGFTLGSESFAVGLAMETEFELIKVSKLDLQASSLLKTSFHQGLHLTSTSKDTNNYLFSKVKDIKELVRLK